MAATLKHDTALSQLQSRSQVELLDAVDRLRQDGFQGELELPQLIVCGDQSSGKSSVLEAISRVRFPASDVLCTRFATEMVLRRAEKLNMSFRIEPAGHRSLEDRKWLLAFRPPIDITKPEHCASAIEAAGKYLSTREPNVGFFEDKLICNISAPDMPPLTLVDLPGIIHSSETDKQRGKGDIETVRRLVESYMQMPSSIILAVLAADNNFSNQVVLEMASTADPDGNRTLGIITKPDKVYEGSSTEISCLRYAQNRGLRLGLGWHVLCNRNPLNASISADERDTQEAGFFRKTPWNTLPGELVGAAKLRSKLSEALLQSLHKSLPTLLVDLRHRVAECRRQLKLLGEPKESEAEQRRLLMEISLRLQSLIKDGTRGNYQDVFFNTRIEDAVSARRLRARVRLEMDNYANHMITKGGRYNICSDAPVTNAPIDLSFQADDIDINSEPPKVSSADFEASAVLLKCHNRSQELPGAHPANFVGAIFRAQSTRWKPISEQYARSCFEIMIDFFKQALYQVAPTHVASSVMSTICSPRLETTFAALEAKVDELYTPYETDQPNTLWPDFLTSANEVEVGMWSTIQADMARMSSYYYIARTVLVENFANLAIENCLIKALDHLFDPVTVQQMTSVDVMRMTQEPANIICDRDQQKQRLQTLQEILTVCNRHDNSFGITTANRSPATPVPSIKRTVPSISTPVLETPKKEQTPVLGRTLIADEAVTSMTSTPRIEVKAILTPPSTPESLPLKPAGEPQVNGKKVRSKRTLRRSPSPLSDMERSTPVERLSSEEEL